MNSKQIYTSMCTLRYSDTSHLFVRLSVDGTKLWIHGKKSKKRDFNFILHFISFLFQPKYLNSFCFVLHNVIHIWKKGNKLIIIISVRSYTHYFQLLIVVLLFSAFLFYNPFTERKLLAVLL